ncbi:MAG TPA: glycosyltransferase family 87 protein [Oculatellaceae cyanobacterium]
MRRPLLMAAIAWTVVFLTLVGYLDFDPEMQKLIQISDYLMTFHVGGYVIAHGLLSVLYPPADSTAFAKMAFDNLAHQVLPQMPVSSVAEFMYMPLAAAVFAPLSYLPLNISLFVWQVVSVAALFVGTHLTWRSATGIGVTDSGAGGTGPERDGVATVLTRLLGAFGWLPVCLTIWIGQVGLVFGLLPLASGYFLLTRKRPFLAGVVWSLAIFKPQFLMPAFVVLIVLLLRKDFRCIVGVISGLLLIMSINLLVFGPGLSASWLGCLKVSDVVYSDPRSGIATHIATSLPRTLLLMAATKNIAIKPLVYGFAGVLLLSALAVVWKNRKIGGFDDRLSLHFAFLIGIFVTPLVMPHFFFYDYCLFALSAPLAFAPNWPPAVGRVIRTVVLLTWAIVDMYAAVVLVAHQFAVPLVFMLAMFVMYLLLARTGISLDKDPANT